MKKILYKLTALVLVVIFTFASPLTVRAAVGRLASGSGAVGTGVNTVSATVNGSAGSNTLIVAVVTDRGGSDNTATPTCYGNNMTQIGAEVTVSGPRYSKAWYYLAPAGTDGSCTVTRTLTISDFAIVAAAYSGVSQTGFPDASQLNQTGTAASFTGTLTTVANNAWGVVLYAGQGNDMTAGAGTSKYIQNEVQTIFDNSGTTWSPAGSFSLTGTMTSENFGFQMVSFAPSGAAPAATIEEEYWFFFW